MKKIKLLTLLLLSIVMVTSCVDDDVQAIEGALANTPYVIGFDGSSTDARVLIDGTVKRVEIPVNLINGLDFSGNPEITASYVVSPQSTAVAGVEYNFVNSSQSVTIPADREFGMIEIDISTNNIDIDEPKTLILLLSEPSRGLVAQQFQQITINIVGFCESDLAGAYTSNETIDAGAPNATIEEVGDGLYRISSMPYIAFGGGRGNPAWIEFSDVCGVVEFGDWVGATLAVGSGTVNGDGSITFDSLTIYNNNVEDPNDIWFDLGSSTYTPSN